MDRVVRGVRLEIEEFWSKLSESVGSFGRNEWVVVLWDLNVRVGNEVIEGIVTTWSARNK